MGSKATKRYVLSMQFCVRIETLVAVVVEIVCCCNIVH